VTPVAELMKEFGISPKVRLPEDKAPATNPERIALLKFFDCFAKAQPDGLKAALAAEDAAVLAAMTKGDGFAKACAPVSRIDLNTGSNGGKSYVMAVYRAGGKVEAQLWSFQVEGEDRTIAKQAFASYVQPVDVMGKISGSNLIADWIKLVDAEKALANEPDQALKPTARVQETEKDAGDGGGSEEPSGPIGAPPMRNKPPPGGIEPPGRRPGK
jgi:hypothetical protein